MGDLIFVSKVSIPNLSLLVCLEVAYKFVVVGGWWVVVVSKLILVISLKPKSRLINSDSSHIKSENVRFEQALIRSHSR